MIELSAALREELPSALPQAITPWTMSFEAPDGSKPVEARKERPDMADDEQQIRTLIERWADAVDGGDMSGVLADHADYIVMFDVPAPYEGVRGIDAYRET
jgi:hypothetical protein